MAAVDAPDLDRRPSHGKRERSGGRSSLHPERHGAQPGQWTFGLDHAPLYYRSTDSTITTGDTEVGTDSVFQTRRIGERRRIDPPDHAIHSQAPTTTAPAWTRCPMSQTRSTTARLAVTVTVGAAPAPDLVVDTPTVSESAPAAGARFTLSATVRNQGSGPADVRPRCATISPPTRRSRPDDTEVGTDSVFQS